MFDAPAGKSITRSGTGNDVPRPDATVAATTAAVVKHGLPVAGATRNPRGEHGEDDVCLMTERNVAPPFENYSNRLLAHRYLAPKYFLPSITMWLQMPTNYFSFNQGIGLIAGLSVFSAVTCPLMSSAAEASDIDKVPVPALVAAVASGVSISTITVHPVALTILDGEVTGHGDPVGVTATVYMPRK